MLVEKAGVNKSVFMRLPLVRRGLKGCGGTYFVHPTWGTPLE